METFNNKHNSQEKLEALFLNKVKGLKWYYFQINLNERSSLASEADSILEQRILKNESGEFLYEDKKSLSSPKEEAILSKLLEYTRENPQLPREIIKRIFDSNEPTVMNNSGAEEGILGKSNRRDNKKRKKAFNKKIRNPKFHAREDSVIIMAEGDSWFQFPAVRPLGDSVKDIIDCLSKRKNYAVYSIASGGDWLSNIVKTGEYIEELDRMSADVFMLSGGGNDMLGDYRLAQMVNRPEARIDMDNPDERVRELLQVRLGAHTPQSLDVEKYKRGLSFLNDNFYNFLNLTMSQFFLLLSELMALPRYKHMKFITHGYDFVIPTYKRRGFLVSRQKAINSFMDTGKWIHDALARKRIIDPEDQHAIMYTMIYEFNEMLIQLASYEKFTNLFHIDCRGTGEDFNDWFDEIHLNSKKFHEVSGAFHECIDDQVINGIAKGKKVYKVRKDLHFSSQCSEDGVPVITKSLKHSFKKAS
ncbi:MAG: hypothetical protein KDD99_21675 [Bacteroidetes bacterium]|nr:hypothetical protein [Bacteroidota bacterium]